MSRGLFHKPKIPPDRTPFWDLMRYIIDWCDSERVHISGWKVDSRSDGKYFTPPQQVAAISGWHKQSTYEVDPTIAYGDQVVIHIQPTHALVVTGIRDAANPTGGLVTSCAGFWVSTQPVPAKTTVSGNDVWNLPQFPLPVPTNIDDPANFWIYLGETMACS